MKLVKILFVICSLVVFGCTSSQNAGGFGEQLWDGDHFVQKTVDASRLDENIIRAKVEGEWQEFTLTDFPEIFITWNFKRRIETIEGIAAGNMPSLDGPHNGIVATYGYKREDSKFKVNNAIKGCGFLPRKDKIKEIIQLLKDTNEEHFMKKLDILIGLYAGADSIFDMNKQVSLELYAVPERGTQTFLNQMTDPTSVIVFMDIPTFKLKTIAYLLHPQNPYLTDYEKDVVEYINMVHSYFHGEFSKDFIAVVYNVIEVYNSSPGNKNSRGTLIVP